jgi:hypothetical protein
MAAYYQPVSAYVSLVRSSLQDLVSPYRYADTDIYLALNTILGEVSRARPDIFLDLKYIRPLQKGDLGDGLPPQYVSPTDDSTLVPVPSKYFNPVIWGMSGWLQLYDVADTQDQRAGAFLQRFATHLLSLALQ